VVAPSPVDTDLLRGVPEEKIQALLQRLAVKRRAGFEDVANVIDFFIRPESGLVTGQVIYLGGI
jgi:3-oxoacyl-[acyl-carrier protein] reductase